MMHHQERMLGFTLIELMVTVALAAILAFVAAPNLSAFKRNAELTSATNALVAAISTSRSEALKRNYNVFVMTTSSNWVDGWVVFADANGNGRYEPATDITINTQAAMPSYFTITGGHINPDTNLRYVMFNGTGFAKKLSSSVSAFATDNGAPNTSLFVTRSDLTTDSDEWKDQSRRVIVSITGRVRSCNPKKDSDCTASST